MEDQVAHCQKNNNPVDCGLKRAELIWLAAAQSDLSVLFTGMMPYALVTSGPNGSSASETINFSVGQSFVIFRKERLWFAQRLAEDELSRLPHAAGFIIPGENLSRL